MMHADTTAAGPGFRTTVGALALGQIVVWAGLFYTFSSMVLPMQQDLGWSKPTLMGAFTLGLAVWGASSYGVGALIDAGRGRLVMTVGSALAGGGFLAWAQVSQAWQLYAVWAVLGLAMAMNLYEPAFAVLTKRYPTRYLQGITALTLVGGFASTLSFPAVAALMGHGLSWRQTLQVMGVVLCAMAPLHAWALRGPAIVAAPPQPHEADDATLHQALRSRAFWLLTLCFALYAFGQAAMWAHVMPAFADKGVAQADAMVVLMTVGPAQVAGRLLYVAWGRGWSLRVLGSVVLTGLPLAMLLFALGQSLPALLVFALLFGMANGLVTIVRGGLVPLYFGRGHVGRIGGLMSGIGLFTRASAPVVATAWLALLPGYRELLLALAALGVAAVLAFWAARPPAR
jgi:MFS family permease